jgi:transposase
VHYTHGLADFVCQLSRFMPLADVARLAHLGWDTVKAIVKSDLARRYASIPLKGLRRLAIDELYLGKAMRFITLVIDLDTGRIVWVSRGRGKDALKKFWRRLRLSKARIEAVACDMSAAYWAAVLEHLPQAAIVFDRFHIIKLANEKIDDLRRSLQREADALGYQTLKGSRYLLLAGKENVPEDKQNKLSEALRFNQPLSTAYYLKEELRVLWERRTRQSMQRHLERWIERALDSGIQPMQTLAKTLRGHAAGILNWFEHPISSGKLEGINNKVGAMTRAAFGYRDEEFLHLKLYSLHESSLKLTGV